MDEKLIQIRVDSDIKVKADNIFKMNGITTQVAIRIFLYNVSKNGKTPFNNLFIGKK